MEHKDENITTKKIAVWLEKLKFRKQFIGGVSEQDVWKKIAELNELYQAALEAERVRYDTMIAHYRSTGREMAEEELAYDD